uniref:Uncharacterized protein n=1 Tax=Arion vulgaris TaxID=1028688 RepID=A0A0B7BN06_9EUPU
MNRTMFLRCKEMHKIKLSGNSLSLSYVPLGTTETDDECVALQWLHMLQTA